MNQIIQKMQELVDIIDKLTFTDEAQRAWAIWWARHLRMAVEKAKAAGWVQREAN